MSIFFFVETFLVNNYPYFVALNLFLDENENYKITRQKIFRVKMT